MRRLAWLLLPLLLATCRLPPRDGGDLAARLPEVQPGLVHRADYDARYQAHILVQLLQRQRRSE